MLTDCRRPTLQVKAYLKRMASSYGAAPEPERDAELDALLAALDAEAGIAGSDVDVDRPGRRGG